MEAVAPEAGDVDENVAELAAVGQDETVALGDVEPFDGAGNFDDPRIVAFVADKGFVSGIRHASR